MTAGQRAEAEWAILAAVEGSRYPLSFVTLRGVVYRTTGDVADGELRSLLARLVARRLIVRRPVDPGESGRLRHLDPQLLEFYPSGRDPWVPYAVAERRLETPQTAAQARDGAIAA